MPTDSALEHVEARLMRYAEAQGRIMGHVGLTRADLKSEYADPRALLHALLNDIERVEREMKEAMDAQ